MTIKKLVNTLILAFFIIPFISCTKSWLNQKPSQDVAIPSTLTDFQAILDNTGIINQANASIGDVASDGRHISDAIFNATTDNDRNAYTWSHTAPYRGLFDWISPYARIFYCNLVLDGLNTYKIIKSTDSANFYNIKGQALFNRGRLFYDLSQLFCPPYVEDSLSNGYGLNLRLESDVNKPVVRSTIGQTYQQIISDLSEAISYLPNRPLYKTRASKPAAYGMLSRVYLSMGNYSQSKLYADSCLSLYSNLLDYNSIDSTQEYPFTLFNSEVIFHCEGALSLALLKNFNLIDSSFFSLYSNGDFRKTLYFIPDNLNAIKYRGSYTQGQTPFTGIATDEIYLIRAECLARMGDLSNALKDLNTLLMSRFATGTFIPNTSNNGDSVLTNILLERRKELLMRNLRWTDLRRLNEDPKFATTIERSVNGINYSLDPNSYRYTFPIPDDVLNETKIPQNPGW